MLVTWAGPQSPSRESQLTIIAHRLVTARQFEAIDCQPAACCATQLRGDVISRQRAAVWLAFKNNDFRGFHIVPGNLHQLRREKSGASHDGLCREWGHDYARVIGDEPMKGDWRRCWRKRSSSVEDEGRGVLIYPQSSRIRIFHSAVQTIARDSIIGDETLLRRCRSNGSGRVALEKLTALV